MRTKTWQVLEIKQNYSLFMNKRFMLDDGDKTIFLIITHTIDSAHTWYQTYIIQEV